MYSASHVCPFPRLWSGAAIPIDPFLLLYKDLASRTGGRPRIRFSLITHKAYGNHFGKLLLKVTIVEGEDA
jgi:hypothetical protein